MSEMSPAEQENARLAAEIEQLRAQRDAYHAELDALRQKSEETISAQLRLLSVSLSKEIKEDFFSMLKTAGWVVAVVGVIATAGGLWKLSDVIDQAVGREVEKREKDISRLRENVIDSVVEFKGEAKKALEDIEEEKTNVAATSERARSEIESRARISITSATFDAPAEVITIPVVVHVVYNKPEENISEEQIRSQIEVLNNDFRARNEDISKVPEPFKQFVGDAHIQFALATRDPEGKPSSGIVRTRTTKSSFGSNDDIKSSATGGSDAWPTDKYLNIWVGRLAGGILGYAQFPGGPAATDGVVIFHTAFGTTGTVAAPFNKGRTTTSQIGRYLNLRSIWGDDQGCDGTDFVTDTPNAAGPNFGTPTFPRVSCNNGPHGDMFMNFMDYVDDEAAVMFTKGQVARMWEALQGPRSKLGRS